MKISRIYENTKFPPEVIQKAIIVLESFLDKEPQKHVLASSSRTLKRAEEDIRYDSDEEFFADFRKDHYNSYYEWKRGPFTLTSYLFFRKAEIGVTAPERQQIEAAFAMFEANKDLSKLPEIPKPKPRIFIGHGRSEQWRDLRDHLQDKHGHEVIAYETGARAGHTIRDVLEKMLNEASFAVLVMTGEDESESGALRTRPNVIHELGLFQGRLGFSRAIVLLEDCTDIEEFSNLQGINQIRYSKSNIKETFGEVLATLKREFGD